MRIPARSSKIFIKGSEKMKLPKCPIWVLPPLIILLAWSIVTEFGLVDPLFIPAPYDAAKALVESVVSENIIADCILTLARICLGFIIGSALGILIGLLIGYYSELYSSMEFVIEFLRSTPLPVIIPLFLLFFGIGEMMKIFVIVWACCLILLVNAAYGVKHCIKTRIIVAKVYKANDWQIFYHVLLPESLPSIFAGLRIAIVHAVSGVLFVEMLISSYSGLGSKIFHAQQLYKTPELYALIIIAACIGYVLNKAIIMIEKRVIHWTIV